MKSKLLLLIVLVVFAVSVDAQSKSDKDLKFGIGAAIGLPTGDASTAANLAYVVDVMGQYGLADKLAVTLSAGYQDWSYKTGFSKGGLIPVLAGIKYDFTEKIYGSALAGLSIASSSGNKGSAFTFAPGVGYKISEKFDLLLKYQSATKNGSSLSFFALRAGFTF